MSIQDDIAKTSKKLFIREPFFASIFLGLRKIITNKIPTLAIGKEGINAILYINPDFWQSLSDTEKLAVIKHEVLHLAYFHPLLGKSISNRYKFNIAADAEINQYIDGLPEGCVDFRKLGFSEIKAGTKFYYDNMPGIDVDGNSLFCPSSGNPDESGDPDGSGDPYDGTQKSHSTWKEFDEIPESDKEAIKATIKKAFIDAYDNLDERSRGTVPGHLRKFIEDFKKTKPVYNWRKEFRRMTGNSMSLKLKTTRKRPSRRFPDNPGVKFIRKKKILCAIDTSGSVGNSELNEFFQEVYNIYRMGVEVWVVECDAAMYDGGIYKFKPGFTRENLHGGGGTDFNPAVNFLNEHRNEYDCLIYLTDGHAPDIKVKPRKPIFWVISSIGLPLEQAKSRFKHPVVKIDNNA